MRQPRTSRQQRGCPPVDKSNTTCYSISDAWSCTRCSSESVKLFPNPLHEREREEKVNHMSTYTFVRRGAMAPITIFLSVLSSVFAHALLPKNHNPSITPLVSFGEVVLSGAASELSNGITFSRQAKTNWNAEIGARFDMAAVSDTVFPTRLVDRTKTGITDPDLAYTWQVDEIEVPDTYALHVEALFETNLPSPKEVPFSGSVEVSGMPAHDTAAVIQDADEPDAEKNSGAGTQTAIHILQECIIFRTGFSGMLRIDNTGDTAMEQVSVQIEVKDAEQLVVTPRFVISAPELNGISDVSGSGRLESGASATAVWTILPTQEITSDIPKRYEVGGTLSYTHEKEEERTVLIPDSIWVYPDPVLKTKYFMEQEVGGDDPYTEETEPALPFTLGILATNTGSGPAQNVTVISNQPQAVYKGQSVPINISIIGTQVGAEEISPLLTAALGNVESGASALARWQMVSTLQGEFIDFDASFERTGPMDDPQLSLMENVEIHPILHVVHIEGPLDDGLPDFLVNDVEDPEMLPETIISSANVQLPVNAVTDVSLIPVKGATAAYDLMATLPAGWVYVKVASPVSREYRLTGVLRSGGGEVRLHDNAWTTHRIRRPEGQPAFEDNLVHFIDFNDGGSYRLLFDADSEGEAEGEGETPFEGETMYHPADSNTDQSILMSEAISYLAGWQQGANPMAYAIRAAYLWQNGEHYIYDGDQVPPLCWTLAFPGKGESLR